MRPLPAIAVLLILTACGATTSSSGHAALGAAGPTVPINSDGSFHLADAPNRHLNLPLRKPPDGNGTTGTIEGCTLKTTVNNTVLGFSKDSATITSAGATFLRSYIGNILSLNEIQHLVSIDITGYASTDAPGEEDRDHTLSQARADATANVVRPYLTTHSTVKIGTPTGQGEANPIADNGTETGRVKNRRVVLQFNFSGCS